MKKILCLIMIFAVLGGNFVRAIEFDLSSKSAVLLDVYGNIIYEKNSNEQNAPASVTKIMTLLLTMEAIEKGQISLDDIVTVSKLASQQGGSQVFLAENEQIYVHDLIKCVAVSSANDGATALAEFISGSREEFVKLMNERAFELGMQNTTFKNPTGLTEDGHLTTAYDVALMSVELLKHEKIYAYTTIWIDSIRDGEFELANTNKLLKNYEGIVGLKTGYTSEALHCISAVATRDEQTFIAVCMGAESSDFRSADVSKMLDYAFANYESVTLKFDKKFADLAVINGEKNFVEIEAINTYNKFLFEKNTQIDTKILLDDNVQAPIFVNDKVGEIIFVKNDENIHKIDIVAMQDVQLKTFKIAFFEFLHSFFMGK